MFPKLKISEFLLKRLERVKQQCSGCLFGVFYGDGTLLLMGFNVESTIGQLNYEQIQHKFPAELDLCGLVKFGDCTDAEAHLTEIFKDVDITDNPILLHCELGTLVGLRASIFMHGKLQEVPYEVMPEEELYNEFCFSRLRCTLNICTEPTAQSVHREMNQLRKVLSGGSLAFKVASTKMYITNAGIMGRNGGNSKTTITNDSYIQNILEALATTLALSNVENNKENNKKRGAEQTPLRQIFGAVGCDYDVFNIDVLRCKTRERTTIDTSEASGDNKTLPAISMYLRSAENKLYIPLEVEAMAVLAKQTKVSRLYDILIESISRGLRLCEQSLIERLDEQIDAETVLLSVPRVHHFYHTDIGHFLSCSYLDSVPDDNANMQERRKRLHRHFGLGVVRPYFRRANRCIFYNELPEQMPLFNTHLGLRNTGAVPDGKQYLVQGNYQYYHYLQQQVQDKGWGCAYRSLQTICSWFRLQGYTDRVDVPTHREIQQYLVGIGDKPQNFVGSSKWIGSTEISMCLQGFLNIDSKILHVASGGELNTLASELAMHFQTQGTPIMIGGGVLAHTIIGIDYCVQTGAVRFLILDPHYTGADELQTIQAKGWCGWKGMDFWDKKSYYNLCLPQRPLLY